MTFRLALKTEGDNPLYWQSIDQLIGMADISIDPDAEFTPHAEVVPTLSGQAVGRGFAIAKWHWNVLSEDQRAILREFCPDVSSEVYIETETNEIDLYGDPIFIQASAIMRWPAGGEDLQIKRVLGLDILFTHLVEVS